MWRWYANKNDNSHARVRNKLDIQRDILFQKFKSQYKSSQIDLTTFIRSVGYMFNIHENGFISEMLIETGQEVNKGII